MRSVPFERLSGQPQNKMAAVAELSVTPSSIAEASLSKARKKRRRTTIKERKEEPVSPTDNRTPQPLPLSLQREIPLTREEPGVTETSFNRDIQNGRQDENATPPSPAPSPPPPSPPPPPPLLRTHSDEKDDGGVPLSGDVDHHGDQGGEEERVRLQVEQQQEDEDKLIGLIFTILNAYPLKAKLTLQSLSIRLSVCNRITNTLHDKSHPHHAAVSYYEKDNPQVDYILPVMSQPCYLSSDHQGILQANWNEEVIIYERRSHLFNPHTLLLVELLHLKQQATPTPIAWGWVLIGRMPLDRKICVKLYRVPKRNYFKRGPTTDIKVIINELLNIKSPKDYPTVLCMNAVIKDSTELTNDGRVLRSTSPLVPESSTEGLTKLKSSRLKGVLHDSINSIDGGLDSEPQWSRLPGQSCAVPSKLDQYLLTGSNGCSALSFSHSGRFLAAGVEDNGQFMIKIYQVIKWVLLCTLPSDTNIIYKLSWSTDDNQLACASASGLCHVWSFTEAGNYEILLPHPSYVYCCEWIGPPSKDWPGLMVTGCYDGAIRCWKQHQLTHVEDVHSSVNALVFDTKQSILYSGDSSGAIKMWKINNDDWTIQLHCNILIPEYKGVSIRDMSLLPWSHQVIVYRPKGFNQLTKIDIRIESVTVVYSTSSAGNAGGVAVGGASRPLPHGGMCVSPCGTLLLSVFGSSIYIWNASNGKLLDVHDCGTLRSNGITCQYHPYEHLFVCSGIGHNQVISLLS